VELKRLTLEHVIVRPHQRRYAVPLLLVHGAWHGAWCWRGAMEDFAERGFEVHAVSLRGHGASDTPRSFNLCSLVDYLRDLATAVDSIHPRPVVVGHSMGGFVLQLYLQQLRLPRAVLLCSIPASGIAGFMLRWLLRHPAATLWGLASLQLRRMVGSAALARDAFLREGAAPHELDQLKRRLGHESYRAGVEALLTTRPDPALNQTPLLVVAAERDQIFTIDEQRSLAAAYHAEFLLIPDAAHDLMLDPAWPLVADAIERFVVHGSARPPGAERGS
jgi:pimeloyl-ACP methyl ester carboxylesterase